MECGDAIIDGLLAANTTVQPLTSGRNVPAVGHLHDLLRGHGYATVPDARSVEYRNFGSATVRAIETYRAKHRLPPGIEADSALLRDLIERPAPEPCLSPAYVTLVLDTGFPALLRFVWLTSLFEAGGSFSKLALNTDRCGVSFGILQWSQRAGQLHTILAACSQQEPKESMQIMGLSAADLLAHISQPSGGLNADGFATNSAFELTAEPWKSRLQALGASPTMQRVQLRVAAEAYGASLTKIRCWMRPTASERTTAFLLDLANQFGPGRVQQQYRAAVLNNGSEADVLKQLEDQFTNLARAEFQAQVRARREFFRTTALLSDKPLL